MRPSPKVYDMASVLETIEPWLAAQLPQLDRVARDHFVHLVTGIVEQQSLLVRAIAASSVFVAEPQSNYVQVQRILQDTRLTVETIYYPFLRRMLALLNLKQAYITLDETNHGDDFNMVLVGLATDGISLPLGFVVYPTDGSWADDARALLVRIEQLIPGDCTVIVLADRGHAGDPFLRCLDTLGWDYIVRLPEDTYLEHDRDGWIEVRELRKRAGRMRVFSNVRVWKGADRRATICVYRLRLADGTTTTWYLITNLSGEQLRFVEYACRWWQECTHKLLKSGMFDWERSRVTLPQRVVVLLMGFGCASWALWILGRAHERLPKRKMSTTRTQVRRQNVLKRGWEVLQTARKRRAMPVLPPPPPLRVLTYQRFFPGWRLSCDASQIV